MGIVQEEASNIYYFASGKIWGHCNFKTTHSNKRITINHLIQARHSLQEVTFTLTKDSNIYIVEDTGRAQLTVTSHFNLVLQQYILMNMTPEFLLTLNIMTLTPFLIIQIIHNSLNHSYRYFKGICLLPSSSHFIYSTMTIYTVYINIWQMQVWSIFLFCISKLWIYIHSLFVSWVPVKYICIKL